jgi:aerobic carbon-monoxide dehydrogenase small subunit
MAMIAVSMTVNDTPVSAQVEPQKLLVGYLRDDLGLTGTHVGCETSQCGACIVHVDGSSIKSCTMLAVQAEADMVPPMIF